MDACTTLFPCTRTPYAQAPRGALRAVAYNISSIIPSMFLCCASEGYHVVMLQRKCWCKEVGWCTFSCFFIIRIFSIVLCYLFGFATISHPIFAPSRDWSSASKLNRPRNRTPLCHESPPTACPHRPVPTLTSLDLKALLNQVPEQSLFQRRKDAYPNIKPLLKHKRAECN